MANNDSATPITTGSVAAEPKKNGIYYFKLDSGYFFYEGDEQRPCGLSGAEIDSDLHFLSGMDIKNVELNESANTITITRVNGEDFSAITLDLTAVRPKEFRFDKEEGKLYMVYPDDTEMVAEGFFIDFNDEGKYDVKVYTDGTIDGLGTEYSPLSLSRLERTGTYAPVETLIEDPENENFKGRRVLTKELIDDYGHLYNYDEVEAIQSALTAENSAWRVATKADWDELLNAMEAEDEYRTHDDCNTDRIDRFHGEQAGGILKSAKYWKPDSLNQDDSLLQKSVGFNALPVGCRPYRSYSITDPENDIEGFGEITGFWALKSSGDTCPEGNPFIKFLCYQYDGVSQKRPPEDDGYSVRLVRECVEGCPEQYETILGSSYPVGPITSPCGVEYCKIWTLSNFYSTGNGFSGYAVEGENVPKLDKYAYFINECDGKKKRMMEGDSIVILDNDGVIDHEYRIIDGELVDMDKQFEDMVNDAKNELDNTISELSAATESAVTEINTSIDTLSANTDSALTEEANRAIAAEESLSGDIASLHTLMEERLLEVEVAVEDEIDRAVEAEEMLSQNLSDLSGNTTNEIAALRQNIVDTVASLLGAEERLSGEIESETNRAIAAESALSSSINTLSDNTDAAISELRSATGSLSTTLNDAVDSVYLLQDRLPVAIEEAKSELNATKVNDLYFDEVNKIIKLLKADGTLTDGISAADFLKDSVLSRVRYDAGNEELVFIWNDDINSETRISLSALANIYGIGDDSLAYLKMSGTNISAIVDKSGGFEKTLATTKYVDDKTFELEEATTANTAAIEVLNGNKDVPGSIKHTLNDTINTTFLTAGLPVTNVSVDDASNNSLIRTINANGEVKYFVSNNAKDMLATDGEGFTVNLNYYLTLLENKISVLRAENDALKDRVDVLERRVTDLANTGVDETGIKEIIKNYLAGTDKEIKVAESGGTLQIGFADNAVFGEEL